MIDHYNSKRKKDCSRGNLVLSWTERNEFFSLEKKQKTFLNIFNLCSPTLARFLVHPQKRALGYLGQLRVVTATLRSSRKPTSSNFAEQRKIQCKTQSVPFVKCLRNQITIYISVASCAYIIIYIHHLHHVHLSPQCIFSTWAF